MCQHSCGKHKSSKISCMAVAGANVSLVWNRLIYGNPWLVLYDSDPELMSLIPHCDLHQKYKPHRTLQKKLNELDAEKMTLASKK